jgi:hypothetical protein
MTCPECERLKAELDRLEVMYAHRGVQLDIARDEIWRRPDPLLAECREVLREAEHYMHVMTNGPGDAPGMWLKRYAALLARLDGEERDG